LLQNSLVLCKKEVVAKILLASPLLEERVSALLTGEVFLYKNSLILSFFHLISHLTVTASPQGEASQLYFATAPYFFTSYFLLLIFYFLFSTF
jgi:hypothetical protein